MKKEWIRIGIAFLVLIGLLGYFSWHKKRKFVQSEQEEKEKTLVTADLSKIDRMVISRPEKIVFERRTKKGSEYDDAWASLSNEFESIPEWKIVEPIQTLPDYFSMSGLFSGLKEWSYTKVIDDKGAQAQQYGLNPALVTVEFFQKDKLEFTIKMGEENSAKTGVYAQVSPQARVVLAEKNLDFLKTRTLDEWRKKEIVGWKDFSKVSDLVLSYPGAKNLPRLHLQKTNDKWSLKEPKKFPADQKVIEVFLNDLKGLRANRIVSENASKDSKIYGFEKPYAIITVKEGVSEKTVLIGNKFEKDKDIYIIRKGMPQIYAVRSALKESLTKNMKDLIDRHPLQTDINKITGLTLHRDKESIELTKKDGKWQMKKPIADRAEASKTTAFLSTLSNLTAVEFLGENLSEKEKIKFSLKVDENESSKQMEFSLGEKCMGRTQSPKLFYSFKKEDCEKLSKDGFDLRQKKLIPSEAYDLETVAVEKGKQKILLKRNAERAWTIAEVAGLPSDITKRIKASDPDAIVSLATGLEIQNFVDKEQDIGPPELQMTFMTKDETMQWFVGRKKGEFRWVKGKERNVLGKVNAPQIEEIEKQFASDPVKKE